MWKTVVGLVVVFCLIDGSRGKVFKGNLDPLKKLSVSQPQCDLQSYFSSADEFESLKKDLKEFCPSALSKSELTDEQKEQSLVLCQLLLVQLNRTCAIGKDSKFSPIKYEISVDKVKVCLKKSVLTANEYLFPLINVPADSSLQIDAKTLCKQIVDERTTKLVRLVYQLHLQLSKINPTKDLPAANTTAATNVTATNASANVTATTIVETKLANATKVLNETLKGNSSVANTTAAPPPLTVNSTLLVASTNVSNATTETIKVNSTTPSVTSNSTAAKTLDLKKEEKETKDAEQKPDADEKDEDEDADEEDGNPKETEKKPEPKAPVAPPPPSKEETKKPDEKAPNDDGDEPEPKEPKKPEEEKKDLPDPDKSEEEKPKEEEKKPKADRLNRTKTTPSSPSSSSSSAGSKKSKTSSSINSTVGTSARSSSSSSARTTEKEKTPSKQEAEGTKDKDEKNAEDYGDGDNVVKEPAGNEDEPAANEDADADADLPKEGGEREEEIVETNQGIDDNVEQPNNDEPRIESNPDQPYHHHLQDTDDEEKSSSGNKNPKHDEVKQLPKPPKNSERKPSSSYDADQGSSGSFVTYFLLFTLFIVIGYLVLHNKNKLIGYLVEGRRTKTSRTGSRPSHRHYEPIQNVNDVIDLDQNNFSTDK